MAQGTRLPHFKRGKIFAMNEAGSSIRGIVASISKGKSAIGAYLKGLKSPKRRHKKAGRHKKCHSAADQRILQSF